MQPTQKAILDKTHYGLNIYAYVLRSYYPGDTVLSLSGRDCKPTKNPFNDDRETLVIKVVDGCAQHTDSENAVPPGDVFDFAGWYFKLSGQELLDKINREMNLRLDEEKSFYKNKKKVDVAQIVEIPEVVSPTISYFRNPVKNTVPLKDISLLEVYNKIRSVEFKPQTEFLRALGDREEARKYKAENFHYVTFSGAFSRRSNTDLKQHSGLLCIDFDHLESLEEFRKKLLEDEYFDTELLFISPSGDGLKWIIAIDLQKATHQEWFRALSNYLKKTYGVETDQSGKDVSRACFLPHDSGAYINPKYLNHRIKNSESIESGN
ncbi:BT4734/BF3469 family protein [Kaistella faecalis]|uniref:BT4734/BF3469 family protein n=1 Tax=Kaistella faecalis TaxID=2852098 RepID=UPI001C481878|nr:BT4734/BF3469 family protein [Chryseobacterium faecale]UFK97701.1 VirE protein [Chryseobacterium faecale]